MSASSSRYARRRLSLLASSSLVAATMIVGVGGVATLAPTQALAANECGNPSANAGLDDNLTCAGAYPLGVTYPSTDGSFILNLEDGVTITNGLSITGTGANNLQVYVTTNVVNGGDPTITNAAGYAVSVVSAGAAGVGVDLRSNDAGDAPIVISGGRGIRAVNDANDVHVFMNGGSVNATAGFGIFVDGGAGTSATLLTGGTTVTSTGTAVYTRSTLGDAQVTTTGQITSTAGDGIFASGRLGVTINAGPVTSTTGNGINATSSAGNIDITTTGAVSGALSGITASASTTHTVSVVTGGTVSSSGGAGISVSGAQGQLTVDTTGGGLVTGTTGVSVTASGNGGIDLDVGDVTGTAGSAVATTTNGSGLTDISIDGALNATGGSGVDAEANDGGDIQVSMTATSTINATSAGIFALSNSGNVTVDGDGTITAAGGYGIYANSNTGSVVVNTAAGSLIDADNGYGIAAGVFSAGGGSVTVTVDGDVGGLGNAVGSDGVAGVIFSAGNSSDINITVNGDVYASGTGILGAGVGGRSSGTGNVTVTANGTVNSGASGVLAYITNAAGAGDASATATGTVVAAGYGVVAVNAGSGDATATAGAGSLIDAGAVGVYAQASTGDAFANANDLSTIIAGTTGVAAASTGGAATVTIGNGVAIDPDDYGVYVSAATDATATVGNDVTVDINNTDADAIAYGVYAHSSAAADTALGDPSVEVGIGTNFTATVDDGVGGEADGGIGVLAVNDGGGTGSVSVVIGSGLNLDVVGDNAAGVVAQTGSGDITINLSAGTIDVLGGDGVDSAGTLPGSAGIGALSTGGDITITTSNLDITVSNGAGLDTAGIYAETTGSGSILANMFGLSNSTITSNNGDGVSLHTVDGFIGIGLNAYINATNGDGLHAEATGTGSISGGTGSPMVITVTGGDGENFSTTSGSITFNNSAQIDVTSGDGINASSTTGNIDLTNGGVITNTTSGAGIVAAASGSGNVSVDNNALINGINGGILASSGSGTVTVDSTGGTVNATAGVGVSATTGGASTVDVDVAAVTASGVGVNASSAGGTLTVDNSGAVSGSTGIVTANTGTGTSTITTGASVTGTTGPGISSSTVDGALIITNNDTVAGATHGIAAISTGAGSITVNANDDVTANGVSSDAIRLNSSGGGTGDITVTTAAGTLLTAGDDGISAFINNAASTGAILINANGAIDPNQGSGFGYGIFTGNAGSGNTTINFNSTASIDGDAFNGIIAGSSGTGGIGIFSTGAIGSVGDPVSSVGISADISNAASAGGINIQSTGAFGIYAGDVGINASNAGTGTVLVFTTSTSPIVVTNAGAIGINATANGGLIQVANNGAITATAGAGSVGINASNVAGAMSVGTSGAISSTGDAIHTTNTGGGNSTIFTVAGGVLNSSTGDGIDATGVNGIIDIDTAANVTGGLNGIIATGTGTSVVTVDTTAASTVIGNGGDGINASSVGGTVTVTTLGVVSGSSEGIDASNTTGSVSVVNSANVTGGVNGIVAAASGAGPVSVTTGAASTVTGNTGDGVRATSAGGTVIVTANGVVIGSGGDGIQADSTAATVTVTNNNTVSGTQNGILTSNTGAGATNLNVNANVTATGAGFSALNAGTTGTGTVTVTIANNRTITDTVGSAVRTTSGGGTVNITTGTGTTLIGAGSGASSWVVDLSNAAGGTTNFTVGANSVVRSTDNTTTGYDDLVIRGIGGSVVVNNGGRIQGRVSFSGLTGNVVFNNTSTTSWHTTGASTFSGGADTLNNTGIIFTNAGAAATSFDFGAGSDTFANSGELIVGEPAQGAATLTITNLETWNNSGRIVFGSSGTTLTAASDGFTNDRIIATGTTFNGTGSSRLVMDAFLGATTQTSCAALTAADCFNLTGGTTTGSTLILVTDANPLAYGAYNPTGIVLVDVTGGTTSATNFSLDPNSSHWRADASSPDGVLDKGLFMYDLILDPATKQHELVGVPDGEAFEFTTLGQAAQSAWYQTTGAWSDRQADLRDQAGDISQNGYGVWMRISGGAASRDKTSTFTLKGTTWSFDTGYDQNTSSLMTGVDFVAPTSGGIWLVGGMVGYVDSDVSFNASSTVASMEGFDIGGYATYLSDGLFVNAVVNANNLDLSWQAPSLAPAGSNIFRSKLKSLGGQVEGGKTFALGGSGFFEPLASLSYVKTTIDDVNVPGATIDWDDQTSFRGSLGLRVGYNSSMDTFNAKFALTGRVWDEFEGDNKLTIHSGGPDLPLGDDFSGTFGEVQGSVNLFSTVNAFSAFATIGTKFKDDYTATEGNLGFRWRW
jgi:hypothetical protein